MVSRVQARVVQQGLPERRVTARSARPSTLALLGRPLSSAEAHRFLLVGGGHQYVMTLITRIGMSCPGSLSSFASIKEKLNLFSFRPRYRKRGTMFCGIAGRDTGKSRRKLLAQIYRSRCHASASPLSLKATRGIHQDPSIRDILKSQL